MEEASVVFVVDDDEPTRAYICALVTALGVRAKSYSSGEEFLDRYTNEGPACLIADVCMRGMSGLELQEKLRELEIFLPVILITAYATTPLAVRAMRNRALTILDKPFEEHELWGAIREALLKDEQDRTARKWQGELRNRMETLTPSQYRVMEMVVAGKQNKQISRELDISMRTVEYRRREVFKRMRAESVAELVRLAIEAGVKGSCC